ncbi:hypothetical protein [Oharaeibacter diazotrophicus]|uniref:Uncharacterized protein n=1 Tax=Oharaeibacter diazotrophicus TaxID=1920512 RepID=A0A4R6RPN4_9HYPH|nr:hypothetical protein [Oharaeibacter diazotrophicus]TDP88713.1 hypothetical protein EDD54_0009 [Oharaeibacter diazotrophicus]BBE74932.1 hypothetical protein OHA_3_00020 [Pleomorphomonas sp. SM30]GLS79225.1 hypothetical protein GCM10007904_45630 [Oharaeibacter diazotrophicus]
MARFTKDQMLDELRTIFLFEADHLAMGAGSAMAVAFIGFESDQYWEEAPSRVDLSRFPITFAFDAGYDFAFQPGYLNKYSSEMALDLYAFMEGTPRCGGQRDRQGETHVFMTQDGFCRTVVDAVHAREKLDDAYGDFTIRDLALLANMTEGAVRNALADRSDNGLRAVPGSKPVEVNHAEGVRWLSGRRGFVPTPNRPQEDRFLREHLVELSSAEALSRVVSRLLWPRDKAPLPADRVTAWIDGTFTFDRQDAEKLAEVLDLDVPLFVGKALEVSMRRDRTQQV